MTTTRLVRRACASLTLGLVAGGLALTPAAQAATHSTTAHFSGCEVRHLPLADNTQIGGETTWSPSLSVEIPTQIQYADPVTMSVALGAMPAGILPEDVHNAQVYLWDLTFTSPQTSALSFSDSFNTAMIDKDQPIPFPDLEYETSFHQAGLLEHRLKSVKIYVTGETAGGAFTEYSFECDQVVNPATLFTVAVYDLAGEASLTLDRGSATPGESVAFTGTNLLFAAPSTPSAQAALSVGGIPVGNVEIDAGGAIRGSFTVPSGLSGRVPVRVANGAKSATAMLDLPATTVPPAPIPPTPVPVVDVKDPSTWHDNAQGNVVNNLARIKVAVKRVRTGKKLKIGGSGFAPNEAVILRAKTGKGKGAKLLSQVVYANKSGAIKLKLRLKKAATGKWRVTGIGVASGRGGAAKFKVIR